MLQETQKAEQLAIDVLNFVKNTLNIHYRFLQSSIDALIPSFDPNVTIATDGTYFYYHYLYILKSYKTQKEIIMRDYLHTILHCVFHHPFVGDVNPYLWDLSCDIAIENVINSLSDPLFTHHQLHLQEPLIEDIKNHIPALTAERIYHYLNSQNISDERLATLREAFYHDDHTLWYQLSHKESEQNKDDDDNESMSSSSNQDGHSSSKPQNKESQGTTSASQSEDKETKEQESLIKVSTKSHDVKEDWKDISESLQTDLETLSKHHGSKIGELLRYLKEVNHVYVNYDLFLRQFAIFKEEMKLNDEEFDYIFYTYGMKLYQNIPIIEPLEYKEDKKINELVIAIDTSASVQGDVVKQFISHTFQILQEKNNFFKTFHLYIIQCDYDIQEITLLSHQQELDNYMDQLVIHGFGGTDFRKVFDLIEKKQMQGELQNLKGLLYFTDGDGLYPYKEPPYKTAFLFYNKPSHVTVPSWAIQVDINEQSFQGGKL